MVDRFGTNWTHEIMVPQRNNHRALIVGYSPDLVNGITRNTELLLSHLPYLELHAAVHCYYPRWKWLLTYFCALATFIYQLVVRPPRIIQIIIGSRGDAVKTLPYLGLGKLSGCKVSLHFRMTKANLTERLPRFARCLVHRCWRYADCYCFLSERLSKEYAAELNPRTKRAIIPNPISPDWLQEGISPLTERRRDLVFLGRWSDEKGIDDLLRAIAGLEGEAICEIYSDVVPKLNPKNCRCHAWLDQEGVRRVLREAKLLLLPSHFEGYPNVLVQAAACGTPFVATRLAGVLDIAEESQAGLLHDVGDIGGMHEAISRLLTDEELWTRCSRNGRRWAQTMEVSQVAESWDQVYADLGLTLPERNSRKAASASKLDAAATH